MRQTVISIFSESIRLILKLVMVGEGFACNGNFAIVEIRFAQLGLWVYLAKTWPERTSHHACNFGERAVKNRL